MTARRCAARRAAAGRGAPFDVLLRGDNRGFGNRPDCLRSRACITIDFNHGFVRLRVNQSCGYIPLPFADWSCHPPYETNGWRGENNSSFSQNGAKIDMTWHLSEAVIPHGVLDLTPSIDGHLTIRPPKPDKGAILRLEHDGFPSWELFYSPINSRFASFWHRLGTYHETGPGDLYGRPDHRRTWRWPSFVK